MPVCNNCHQNFEGKYCSHCGQKAGVGRLTLHEVFHDVIHAFTHAEKGILRLTKELLITPGKVYNGYISGKRKSYFSPVMFFLLTIGLLIFLNGKVSDYENHITHRNDEFNKYLYQHYQKLRYLVCIPIIGLISWLFFYKRYNLAETLSFWFFCLGLACVIGIISFLPQMIFIPHRDTVRYIFDWISWIVVVIHIFIFFFNRSWWSAAKCVLLGILYYLILVYIYSYLASQEGFPVSYNLFDIIRQVFSGR